MLTKTLTGIFLAAIVIPPFIMGGIAIEILIAIVTGIAAYEIAKLNQEKANWILVILIFAAIEVMTHLPVSTYAALSAFYLIVLFVIEIVSEDYSMDQVAYTYLISIILSLAWQGVMRIYGAGFAGFGMLYVAIACYACDTGAYFFGVFLGKHKMNPKISPNKTWEGAIGGYLCGLGFSILVAIYLCPTMPKTLMYTASYLLPAMAEIGDLAFSSIKRRFNLKDFGNLLPEHGGVLDRIDSLAFCLMLFNGLMVLWGL